MFQAKGTKRTARIAVRVTEAERRSLVRAAGVQGLSDFLRTVLRKYLTKGG